MTNLSFIFSVYDKRYVFRIPGKGTDMLITRVQEASVYRSIDNLNIADNVIYIDANTGYKISEFYDDAKNLDAYNQKEVALAMTTLKKLHNSNALVSHEFNLLDRIDYFEKLCLSVRAKEIIKPIGFKEVVNYINKNYEISCLCHIDSVSSNFLVLSSGELKLIDWEYSGMSDPLIDVAMFAIYQDYSYNQVVSLLESYLERKADKLEAKKFYAFIAAASYLWYLWSLYKEALGDEIESYRLSQINYCKRYIKEFNSIK